MLLQNKVALITGGSRGIGRALVEKFSEQGATVAFTYLSSKESAEAITKEITAKGGKAKAYQSNAANFEEAEKLVADVIQDFGRIDCLINNAGITKDNLLLRMSKEDFESVLNVNLTSVFNLVKASMRTLLKQRDGSIINISSVVGVSGNAGQSNYAASKAGIIGFSKSVAKEVGSRNIRCNVVTPGFIETEMTAKLDESVTQNWVKDIPLKRIGKGEDVANTCVFLASDLSTYVTGQSISVCGGMI